MEVAYKTLVRPKLKFAAPIWSPYLKLQIKVRGQRPAGPAGEGETRVVSSICLMNLNGHLLGSVLSASLSQASLWSSDKYMIPAHSSKTTKKLHNSATRHTVMP